MDIKRKKKEKRIQLFGGLIGVCVAVASLFYFFHAEKAEADEACDAGRVLVNGKPAKASVKVKVGDVIEIQFGTKTVKVEVLDIQDTTKKEEAKDLFRYL